MTSKQVIDAIVKWTRAVAHYTAGKGRIVQRTCHRGHVHYYSTYPQAFVRLPDEYDCTAGHYPGEHYDLDAMPIREGYEQLTYWVQRLDRHLRPVRGLEQKLKQLSTWLAQTTYWYILHSTRAQRQFFYSDVHLPMMLWTARKLVKLLSDFPVGIVTDHPVMIAYDIQQLDLHLDVKYCLVPWPIGDYPGTQVTISSFSTVSVDLCWPNEYTAANRRLASILARRILQTEIAYDPPGGST